NGGAGYLSVPSVTLTGGGSGPNFTPATATATLTNGVVTAITFKGGTGYTSAPVVTISDPNVTATATSQINAALGTVSSIVLSGGVSALNVIAGGTGYSSTSPPSVTISGGGGTGATATATVVGGAVTGFTITNAGSGYTAAPT